MKPNTLYHTLQLPLTRGEIFRIFREEYLIYTLEEVSKLSGIELDILEKAEKGNSQAYKVLYFYLSNGLSKNIIEEIIRNNFLKISKC